MAVEDRLNEGSIETPMVVMPLVDRIRPDNVFDIKFVTLSHNTVIGAAGSSILKAEAAVVKGLIQTGYRMQGAWGVGIGTLKDVTISKV